MVSLAHGIATFNQAEVTVIDIAAEIRFDFDTMHFIITVDGIYPSVVKQDRQVMYGSSHIIMGPRTFGVLRHVNLHTYSVDV